MIAMPVVRPVKSPKNIKWWQVLFGYTRKWEVVEDYTLKHPVFAEITVPSGFVFDGASIPKIFRNLLSPTGALFVPGLIHDYAYRYHSIIVLVDDDGWIYREVTKEEADELFLDIANTINNQGVINRIAYLAVHHFGGKAWRAHERT